MENLPLIARQVAMNINNDNEFKKIIVDDVTKLEEELLESKETIARLESKSNTMDAKTLKLFEENYNNEGMCANLPKMIKQIKKEFKSSNVTKYIDYLPWAVVERIFRMQGGVIEIVDWKEEVVFDSNSYNIETGEIEEGTKSALFMHLRGTWNGVTIDEHYPIFNSQNSKVIRNPDSQDLNNSRQRGSVRLIARLTGIGLWIFEQQDGFDDDKNIGVNSDDTIPKLKGGEEDEDTSKVGKTKTKKTTKKEEKVEKIVESNTQVNDFDLDLEEAPKVSKAKQKQDEKDDAMFDILGGEVEDELVESDENVANMLLGKDTTQEVEVKPKKTTPKVTTKSTFENGSEEHSDALIKLKSLVSNHRQRILEFKDEKGKEVLADLTYDELMEIIEELS